MELGKPDAGKPPVRFDEGREADGQWPMGLSIRRFPLLYTPCVRPAGIGGHDCSGERQENRSKKRAEHHWKNKGYGDITAEQGEFSQNWEESSRKKAPRTQKGPISMM